ncbi:cryptochrome/photolyase family protein [Actinomycetospora lemnae]|uniref:Cryptochrome/photolyase family protein n=1 Tax=Actinomycetospora lemnae TaxID=3019891 RepID=A0ABT5SR95_9PSEU|nr:cryptochrome/photolyase family protein [Actinomycetospora sp. DW7H6]MDD7965211.1 cryptochrome/photolyase family protein [Actinomycetospora sp. DW7H6]
MSRRGTSVPAGVEDTYTEAVDQALEDAGAEHDAPLWVFGDQLGPAVHGLPQHAEREVVLVESAGVLRRRRYHRQKLHLVLSGMRHLDADLGDRATYHRTEGYREALEKVGRPVVVHQPTSHTAVEFVERLQADGLVAAVLPPTTFARPRAEFTAWAGDEDSFTMENFYRNQRRRFDVLMEGESPVGGRWNLDHDNREPPPRAAKKGDRATLGVPDPWWPTEDEIDEQVRRDLDAATEKGDLLTVGVDGPRLFAVTPDEARQALTRFVEHRLDPFGPHEDAILSGDPWMAHSLLSVPQNLGVLHPLEAVHAAEQAYHDGTARLNSVEGFVRQILGWREYIWHLYWHFGKGYTQRNEMDHRTALPTWWTELDGDAVTAACLSETLGGVRDRGWVHHIPRLMVLGNHALQREYRPSALSEWFTTSFVDGFAWVMPPNVVGMSQHADGGKLATKPYASGGAYINKMSDHCGDCAFDPKVRVGEKACPFTAGYWQFVHRHQALLRGNQRTARAVATMDRLSDLDAVLEQEHGRRDF